MHKVDSPETPDTVPFSVKSPPSGVSLSIPRSGDCTGPPDDDFYVEEVEENEKEPVPVI